MSKCRTIFYEYNDRVKGIVAHKSRNNLVLRVFSPTEGNSQQSIIILHNALKKS